MADFNSPEPNWAEIFTTFSSPFDGNTPALCFHIGFDSCLSEYLGNTVFRKMIDSGNFVYVSGRLIINDSKYVEEKPDGNLCITNYAYDHMPECCLSISGVNEVTFSRSPDELPDNWRSDPFEEYGPNADNVFLPSYLVEDTPSDGNSRCSEKAENGIKVNIPGLNPITPFDPSQYRHMLKILNRAKNKIEHPRKALFFRAKKMDVSPQALEALSIIYEQIWKLENIYRIYLNTQPSADDDETLPFGHSRPLSGPKGDPFWGTDDSTPSSVTTRISLNEEVFERSEELKMLRNNLAQSISYIEEMRGDFSQLAWAQIERCHCDYKETFREKTLLSDKTFDRIKSGRLNNPDIETVMAICAGLNLGILYGEPLLKSAGFDLASSSIPLHTVYHVLLCTYHNRSIFEWNEVLEALHLPPIRAKAYKEVIT